jgi:ACR3 family arsenite transporter
MVFVWSYLAAGDPAYTLVQVSINDLIMLVAARMITPAMYLPASS